MRPLLLLAAATAIADPYCDSRTTPPPARSLHGFTDGHHYSCASDLAGTWADSSRAPRVWYLTESGSTEGCSGTTLQVLRLDTSMARMAQDTLEVHWLNADSADRDSMVLDSATAARYRTDQAELDSARGTRDPVAEGTITALRVGGVLFLDIEAAEPPSHPLGDAEPIPTHWIWRADASADSLNLYPLSEWWLRARLDSGRTVIGHETVGNGVVLTGSPPVLRRFLSRHLADTLAFPGAGSIHLARWHPDTAS
jgi:hypothetical protein